jgi:hypothetical protein
VFDITGIGDVLGEVAIYDQDISGQSLLERAILVGIEDIDAPP